MHPLAYPCPRPASRDGLKDRLAHRYPADAARNAGHPGGAGDLAGRLAAGAGTSIHQNPAGGLALKQDPADRKYIQYSDFRFGGFHRPLSPGERQGRGLGNAQCLAPE